MTPIICMNCDIDMTREATKNRMHMRICGACRHLLMDEKSWHRDTPIVRRAETEWLAHARTMKASPSVATLAAFASYEEAQYRKFKASL